jgi:rhamnosyltransferase
VVDVINMNIGSSDNVVQISEPPKVLILLATYNGKAYLETQLESIFRQKDVAVNVVVSDDCSSDCTVQILDRFIHDGFPIEVISRTIKFGSAAPNFFHLVKSAGYTGYDFVCFSDQDDIWFDDKIISAIQEITKNNVGGFSSDVIAYWPDSGKKKIIKKSFKQTENDFWFESPGPGCTQVFTAESFQKFKDFLLKNSSKLKEIHYHDWLVYAFYRYNNYGWIISDQAKILYVQHADNQIGANSGLSAIFHRIDLIRSKWLAGQVNSIYEMVSGKKKARISVGFMIANILNIRRRKLSSIFIFICYVIHFL